MAQVVDQGVALGEVGGVPVYWAESDGPARASIEFRVGQADERLPISGISRLCTKVVLAAVGERPYRYRSVVHPLTTAFEAEGQPDEVAGFLGRVTKALASPSSFRVEDQRKQLDEKARRRPRTISDGLLGYRYGPVGVGLAPFPMYGLRWLGTDAVSSWINHYFTAENAVVQISGPPPGKLDLHLRPGQAAPIPEIDPIPLRLPSEIRLGHRGLGLAFVGPHGMAMAAAANVLDRHIQRVLRNAGLDRSPVSVDYRRVSVSEAHVGILIDCDEHRAPAVASYLLGAISDLAGGVPYPEVDRFGDAAWNRLTDPNNATARLEHLATTDLLADDPDEMYDQLEALTADRVTAVLRDSLESAMLLAPENARSMPGRWKPYPLTSDATIDGAVFQPAGDGAGGRRLTVGAAGVSYETLTSRVTVEYASCAAVVQRSGARALWGLDGMRVVVDPDDWVDGRRAVVAIDEAVDPGLVAPQSPGDGPTRPPIVEAPKPVPEDDVEIRDPKPLVKPAESVLESANTLLWLAVVIDVVIVVAAITLVLKANGRGEYVFSAAALLVTLAVQGPLFNDGMLPGAKGPRTNWERTNLVHRQRR